MYDNVSFDLAFLYEWMFATFLAYYTKRNFVTICVTKCILITPTVPIIVPTLKAVQVTDDTVQLSWMVGISYFVVVVVSLLSHSLSFLIFIVIHQSQSL